LARLFGARVGVEGRALVASATAEHVTQLKQDDHREHYEEDRPKTHCASPPLRRTTCRPHIETHGNAFKFLSTVPISVIAADGPDRMPQRAGEMPGETAAGEFRPCPLPRSRSCSW